MGVWVNFIIGQHFLLERWCLVPLIVMGMFFRFLGGFAQRDTHDLQPCGKLCHQARLQ